MKRNTLLLFASTVLFATTSAHAGVLVSHQLGLEAGTSLPSGDFSDAAKSGYNIGAVYQAGFPMFGIGAEFKYHSWGATDDLNALAETTYGTGSEFKHSAWQYGAFGTYSLPLPSPVKPYAKLGVAAFSPSLKIDSPSGSTSSSDTKLGVFGGIGVDFGAPGMPMKFGLSTMYNRLKDSGADFYSINARVMWSLNVTP
jgi:opacity protein-like surface antigen